MDSGQIVAVAITGAYTVLASAGFWSFFTRKAKSKDATEGLVVMLAGDLLYRLGDVYIRRGWIYSEEYKVFHEDIYLPYKELGGNGSVDNIMDQVNRLRIKHSGEEGQNVE